MYFWCVRRLFGDSLCYNQQEEYVRINELFFQKNMKIIQKLSLMIVMNVLMMMSLGVVAYSGMKNTNDAFDESVELPIPNILKLSGMTEAFILSMDEACSYRLSGSEDSKNAYFEHKIAFKTLTDELKRDIDYGAPNIPSEDKQLIDEISLKTEALFLLVEVDLREYPQSDTEGMQEINRLRAQENEVIALLKQYRDMEEEEIRISHQKAEKTTARTNMLLLSVVGIFVIASLVINGLLVRSIIKPLVAFTGVVRRFGKGDMSQRVSLSGNNELAVAADAFNVLADSIQRSQTDLEAQVQKRTTEMKKQLDELERMNTLMIDRELRMIELKKQNTELKNSLGMQ